MRATMKYECGLSKKGYATICEKGGGMSARGCATIICDRNGDKKVPIYTGHKSNETHAVFFANFDDYIIEASHWRQEDKVKIFQVANKKPENGYIEVEIAYIYSEGEWNDNVPEFLAPAIRAAIDKAHEYHCREIYWALDKKPII